MTNAHKNYFRSPNSMQKTAISLSIIILGSLLLLRIALIFSYVPEITGMDNNFVHTVIRLLAGLSPYPDPEAFPYSGNIYSPLYFNLCQFVGIITGVDPEYPIQVYQVCRTVALLCDIVSVFLLYKIIARNFSVDKPFALLVVAFYACLICYLAYTFSRVDSLFLTFYISVFYILTKKAIHLTNWQVVLLSFLSVCCVYSKQNGIILPLLISVWLYYSLHKKSILLYLLVYAFFFGAFLFVYTQLLGYNHLITLAVKGLNNKIDFSWFYVYIFKPLANSILILPICAGLVISTYIILFSPSGFSTALSVVFIIQLGFSTGTAFKWGSSLGYFYESLALSLILITKYVKLKGFTKDSAKCLFWCTSLPLTIFFIHVLLQDYLFFIHQRPLRITEYKQQEIVKHYIRSRLNGKYVLDLFNPNRDFFKNLMYKEIVLPQFDTVDCCLFPDNTYDYSKLKEDFTNGNIKYIIFPKDQPLSSLWNVSLSHYKKDTTIFNFDLYQFQPTNNNSNPID